MTLGGRSVPIISMVTHTIQSVDSLAIMTQQNTIEKVNLALVTCQFFTLHFTATTVLPPCSTAPKANGTESVTVGWLELLVMRWYLQVN